MPPISRCPRNGRQFKTGGAFSFPLGTPPRGQGRAESCHVDAHGDAGPAAARTRGAARAAACPRRARGTRATARPRWAIIPRGHRNARGGRGRAGAARGRSPPRAPRAPRAPRTRCAPSPARRAGRGTPGTPPRRPRRPGCPAHRTAPRLEREPVDEPADDDRDVRAARISEQLPLESGELALALLYLVRNLHRATPVALPRPNGACSYAHATRPAQSPRMGCVRET